MVLVSHAHQEISSLQKMVPSQFAGVSYHDLGEAFVEQTYDGMTLLLAMHVSSAQDVVHEVLQFLR